MVILIAMSTGKWSLSWCEGGGSTVERFVGGVSRFSGVKRAFVKIGGLDNGWDSARPSADLPGSRPDEDDMVRLFALIYLLAPCDFRPAISRLLCEKIWAVALKSVWAERMFQTPFVQENDVWTVDIDERIKLVPAMFVLKDEAALLLGGESAGTILANIQDNVQDYADTNVFAILRLGSRELRKLVRVSSRCGSGARGTAPPWGTGSIASKGRCQKET